MKKNIILYLIGAMTLFSCDDDPVEPAPSTSGTMTCTLNGESWVALTVRGELRISDTSDGIAKRIDLYGSIGLTSSIGIGCVADDTDTDEDIPTGTYREDQENLVTVISISEGVTPVAIVDSFQEDSAKVVISSINATTKECSGTFEFWAHETGGSEITHIATSGVFTNIKYVVVE